MQGEGCDDALTIWVVRSSCHQEKQLELIRWFQPRASPLTFLAFSIWERTTALAGRVVLSYFAGAMQQHRAAVDQQLTLREGVGMLPVLHLLASAIGFASCLASRQHLVYSNASLVLTLSSASRNLAGLTSSSHSLQFLLKNNANPRQLLVSQENREGVVGRIRPTEVNLTRGYFTTLRCAPFKSRKNIQKEDKSNKQSDATNQ